MRMFAVLFFSLIIGVSGHLSGCPTNLTCLEKETCCQTNNGLWSCCPIENGICCSDGLHCCSKNQQCLANGTCLSADSNQISEAFLSKISENQLKSVQCPDGKSECDDGQTCCQLDSGDYACCPLALAICCSDHIHCCPQNHQCDVEHSRCVSDVSIPWLTKVPSRQSKQKLTKILRGEIIPSEQISVASKSSNESLLTNTCPDQNECPDETTCCQTASGSYGCCPYFQGFCCSDKQHCCSSGYVCDDSGERCVRHFDIVKENNRMKQLIKVEEVQDFVCPDGITKCFSNSTCCPNKQDNSYSCCPYAKGVCCGSNGSVCCPNDYDCNVDQLSCQLRDENAITLRNLLSIDNSHRCYSSDIYCSNEQTCCLNNQNSYACCPYQNGQCCSDGEHCCPSGTTCNPSINGCS